MKVNLETVSKVVMASYIGKEDTDNMKDHGIMECLMEKVFNTLKMDKNTKELSKRINSMDKAFSIKMIQLFTEYGKTMNYLW